MQVKAAQYGWRDAREPSFDVAGVAEAYRDRLRAFFQTPERTIDHESLADFLCYGSGERKVADPRPAMERLGHGLSTVRFRRPMGPEVVAAETEMLDTLLIQSDQQNMVTSRFLALLS